MQRLTDGGRRYTPIVARDDEARVLVVDNYDSFTFNLVQYLLELGAVVDVYRNDARSAASLLADEPTHVVLSPGPGGPQDSGVCQDLALQLCADGGPRIPLLGVCLGHQTLCGVHGASVVRAPTIMHGKTSTIHHDGTGVLAGVGDPFIAARYHSLIVLEETLPPELVPVGRAAPNELMAVRHRERPVFGVQFHPESIASEHGHRMLSNLLALRPEAR